MHVPVVGGDIEIAHDRKFRMAVQLVGDERPDFLEPVELVFVLVAADGLAIDHVQIDQPHPVVGPGDDASLWIVQIGNVGDHILDGLSPGQNGHAVVGRLTRERARVACGFKLFDGKLLVHQLGLLQGQQIGLVLLQPFQHLVETDFQGIDVPARDLHG